MSASHTDSGAILSVCGRYRYRLWRRWLLGHGTLAFVMLNPSTADASVDDPTIRKCRGFASRWGFGGIEIVNLFALRSTDPSALATAVDPVGPANDEWVGTLPSRTSEIVFAWGAYGAFARTRAEKVIDMLDVHCSLHDAPVGRRGVMCLGVTKSGHPKHPLYVPYSAKAEAF